jgi:uncharacterized membrane protein
MADAVGFVARWRAAAARLLGPGAVLACAWTLYNLPFANEGTRGFLLALQSGFEPVVASSLLVVGVAVVEAGRLCGRARMLAMVAAAVTSGAVAMTAFALVVSDSLVWTFPWTAPVLWWANFGAVALICIGAVIVEDHRVRSKLRHAALRDARLRAMEIVQRTAEVRLQAARARVEPGFLFAALSAVDRVYDRDAAAGNRLLDDLVTYLRAVMPNLRETPDPDSEAEIARLRAAIERAMLRRTEGEALGDPP